MILLRFLLYICIFLITLILLFPKNEVLSYLIVNHLEKFDTSIKATLENDNLSYVANNSKIYYQNKNTVIAKSFKLEPYFFYNKMEANGIGLHGIAASFFPKKIKKLEIVYSLLDPTNILLSGNGDFGKFTGYVEIVEKKVVINLVPSSILKKKYSYLMKYLKKNKKYYTYEYKL